MINASMQSFLIKTSEKFYRGIARPLLFLTDSEKIHTQLTSLGESLGKNDFLKSSLGKVYRVENPSLTQTLHGINLKNPIGLSAGFDYEARLTGILGAIGFGFGTIGTITNKPYEGNPLPRLGRLIKSRSLMVNKGFKNSGINHILKKFSSANFEIPIGLSIGRTNTPDIKTHSQAIEDILAAFGAAEAATAPFSYYELNISCPNLNTNVEFHEPRYLSALLQAVAKLKPKKPLFIKMPIDKSDKETKEMLDVIIAFPVQGVIFSNLLKNRNDPSLDPEEVKQYQVGNFSGKPTEKRSNELIRLAFKHTGRKLTIIGCGGVFGPEDAYRKIKLGASLIELITGLVYMGPQLPGQINLGLIELLRQDRFSNISQAVGVGA